LEPHNSSLRRQDRRPPRFFKCEPTPEEVLQILPLDHYLSLTKPSTSEPHTSEKQCGGGTLSAPLEPSVTAMLIVRDNLLPTLFIRLSANSRNLRLNLKLHSLTEDTPRLWRKIKFPLFIEAANQRAKEGWREGTYRRNTRSLGSRPRRGIQREMLDIWASRQYLSPVSAPTRGWPRLVVQKTRTRGIGRLLERPINNEIACPFLVMCGRSGVSKTRPRSRDGFCQGMSGGRRPD
jgi:hypothetical protein